MDEKVKALYERLEAGVAEVLDSDRWQAFLRFQATFHRYSWQNTLLIFLQCPNASMVAGLRKWNDLGRRVRAGETAIRILAPRTQRKTAVTDDLEEQTEEKEPHPARRQKPAGFKAACVFDVSQTEGADLPAPPIRLLTGESEEAHRLYAALRRVIPIPVTEEETGRANGRYYVEEDRIALKRGLPVNQAAKTLAHEFVHSLVHGKSAREVAVDQAEAVAEGAAFVICSHFGLDTADYSFGYVASWAENMDLVRQVGGQIQKVAAEVIDRVEAALAAPAQAA